MNKNKTAICFSGQCRALQYTYLNLKHFLIDEFEDCDVFIYAAEDKDSENNKLFLDYLEPKVLKLVKDEPIDENEILYHKHQQRNIQEYLQMLTSWKGANDLRLNYERENNITYHQVIRTRLDVKFFNPVIVEENIDLNYLYVPDFHSFACVQGRGRNDRFAIGNPKDITILSNMIDKIKDYNKDGHFLHAESTLYYHLNKNDVKVRLCPIRFTRVRKFGEEIDTRLMKNPSEWAEIDKPYLGD